MSAVGDQKWALGTIFVDQLPWSLWQQAANLLCNHYNLVSSYIRYYCNKNKIYISFMYFFITTILIWFNIANYVHYTHFSDDLPSIKLPRTCAYIPNNFTECPQSSQNISHYALIHGVEVWIVKHPDPAHSVEIC